MESNGTVLYIAEDMRSFDLSAALETLPTGRREKALALKNEGDRRACVAVYLLLRRALLAEHGIGDVVELGVRDGGKPFIIGHEDICFNLSHCRSAAVCAVSGSRVGVDVETIRVFKDALACRVLGEKEYSEVSMADRKDIAFIRYWTMKESYLKMTGEGIRRNLRSLSLEEARFDTVECVAGGYVCTVCTDLSPTVRPVTVRRVSL